MPAMEADQVCHVAILPSPGMGHITPLVEFGRLLVSLHGLRATVFINTTEASAAQSRLLRSLAVPDGLRIVELPPSDSSGSVPTDAVEARISVIVRNALPSLRSALREASPAPAVLVVDIFGTDAFDIADELGMSKYLFFTTTAASLAFSLYLPALDRAVEGEYTDLPGTVHVPGCGAIPVHDLMSPLHLKREEAGYLWYLYQCRRFPIARGILVNTCGEIEPEPLFAMREDPAFTEIRTPRVYPVGPVILQSAVDRPVPTPAWLQWLDSQPRGSVLFVSFGSGGTLSSQQTTELAWGLELCGQRFLWVVRRPIGGNASATFFIAGRGDPDETAAYLPDGFTKRTEGRGFLLPSWAPQVDILDHAAIGGFLTHAGWNSVLESLARGVAMVVWPLYAEQRMNASMLEELKVAIRVREEGGLVKRGEVERVARLLMEGGEGKALKGKAAELRDCFAKALDEGGSSRDSLAEVVRQWKSRS